MHKMRFYILKKLSSNFSMVKNIMHKKTLFQLFCGEKYHAHFDWKVANSAPRWYCSFFNLVAYYYHCSQNVRLSTHLWTKSRTCDRQSSDRQVAGVGAWQKVPDHLGFVPQ